MHVVHHAFLPCRREHGESRLVAAGAAQGLQAFEIRLLTLAPDAATAEACHAGELAVVALAGCGKLLLDGAPQRFCAPCSLLVPAGATYTIANGGGEPLQLVWVGAPPAR